MTRLKLSFVAFSSALFIAAGAQAQSLTQDDDLNAKIANLNVDLQADVLARLEEANSKKAQSLIAARMEAFKAPLLAAAPETPGYEETSPSETIVVAMGQ